MWYNTFAGIFGGILSYASEFTSYAKTHRSVGHIDGALSTWRYIFLIYGTVTVVVGIVVVFLLPDNPRDAWFLNVSVKYRRITLRKLMTKSQEKIRASARLIGNQQGQDSKKFVWKQCLEAVKQPRYWVVMYI